MALHNDSGLNSIDNINQRIGAGTIGGEHIVPGSVGGRRINQIIDNTDPRVLYGYYGTGTATFTQQTSAPFTRGGTTIWTQTANGAMQLQFDGTSIGVIAPSNPTGDFSAVVYIDGEVAYGRIPIMSSQGFPPGGSSLSTPSISTTATTVTVTDSSNFESSGYIIVDSEIMAYSSVAANIFTISSRGAFGTQVTDHYYDATVYQWSNTLSYYNPNGFDTQNLLFYNPFLSNGPHKITLVCSGVGGFMYLDSFLVGSLIGSKSVNLQTGTVDVTVTTSANGHADIGALQTSNADVQICGVIGYTQTSPTTQIDNANVLSILGVRYDTVASGSGQTWQPIFYIHNGPGSTSVTIRITFSYIGASV
jgi:hypothetical protein